ncbi:MULTISPECIES: hypothetical protein [unclassified Streptomyces]
MIRLRQLSKGQLSKGQLSKGQLGKGQLGGVRWSAALFQPASAV